MTDISNKLFSVIHNANTDRNTEANRIAEMEYLRTNYFVYGYHFAMTRYASGYYHGYVYVGEYGGADSLFIEIPNNVDGKLVVWRRNNAGTYSKSVIS